MAKMISVSTKTGDSGTSGLANGQRLGKDALIFGVLGTQDEVNSWLGLVIAQLPAQFSNLRQILLEIQNTLFYIGAELAQSPQAKLAQPALSKLERRSAALQKKMQRDWTTKFLFPGGNQVAATMDVARTISRRWEREIVGFSRHQAVNPLILKYVNRLSDFLYIARCHINQEMQVEEKRFERTKA